MLIVRLFQSKMNVLDHQYVVGVESPEPVLEEPNKMQFNLV